MKQHVTILIFISSLLLPSFASAQAELGMNIQFNQQLGDLKQAGLRQGWGFGLEGLSQPFENKLGNLNVQFGGRFDASFTGRERTGTFFYSGNGNYPIQVRNTNMGIYGVARFITQPSSMLQLYADGLMGVRWFFSSENIDHNGDDCPAYGTEFLASRFTPSVGGSVGMMVFFTPEWGLDFRATYLQGNRVSFVDLESIQTETISYNYNLRRATTSQLMIQLGINMLLLPDKDRESGDSCDGFFIPFTGCN